MEPLLFMLGFILGSWGTVSSDYDIRKHYDKPYCEEQKIGKDKIKKCYEVKEMLIDGKK